MYNRPIILYRVYILITINKTCIFIYQTYEIKYDLCLKMFFFFLETNIILYFTLRTSRIIMYIIKNICVFLPDDAIFCSRRYNITY